MCVHVLFHLFCMIFNSLSWFVLLLSASCGELTQFRAQPRSEEQPGRLSELVKPRSHETVLPGSGNVILIQPFSAQRRKIKRRGREEMERAHTGGGGGGRVEREISVLDQSSVQSPNSLVQVLFCTVAPWGDMGVVCLMEFWWNGYWQAVCTMPWKPSEPTQGGREGGRRHDRSSTAKRTVPDYCHFNGKYECRYKQAKVSASCSFSWAQTALLFNAGLTLVNNMQNNNGKMWTVVIG